MKITKIEKKKKLYLVEFDSIDKIYVTEDTIVRYMLSKNMIIEENLLTEIKEFSQYSHGKNLALYYISFKQRTENEVRTYLINHDIDQKIIPKILQDLVDSKWINDKEYVTNFLQQNLSSGDKGPYVLKQKMFQKGIPSQLIDDALVKIDLSPVSEKLADKLLDRYSSKYPSNILKEKITKNLVDKGFNYQDAKKTVETLTIEKNETNEKELIYKEIDKAYHRYSKKYDGYELKKRLIQALMRKGFVFDDINKALTEYL
jgi:regulatory protein